MTEVTIESDGPSGPPGPPGPPGHGFSSLRSRSRTWAWQLSAPFEDSFGQPYMARIRDIRNIRNIRDVRDVRDI